MLGKIGSTDANASRLISHEKLPEVSVRSCAPDRADEGQAAHLSGVVHPVADEETRGRIPRPGIQPIDDGLGFTGKNRGHDLGCALGLQVAAPAGERLMGACAVLPACNGLAVCHSRGELMKSSTFAAVAAVAAILVTPAAADR